MQLQFVRPVAQSYGWGLRADKTRAASRPVLGSVCLWSIALASIAVLDVLASTSQASPTGLGLASSHRG
jgi:hypothetical protein